LQAGVRRSVNNICSVLGGEMGRGVVAGSVQESVVVSIEFNVLP
jgi:hypothetical protein